MHGAPAGARSFEESIMHDRTPLLLLSVWIAVMGFNALLIVTICCSGAI
ncbi:hypothetical protein DFLDMN_005619 [Cupriavidus sp. H19C3]